MNQIKSLIALLLVLATGFYLYGIIQGGHNSIKKLGDLNLEYWTAIVIAIGSTLATNLGAVLGFTVKPLPRPANAAPAFLFLRSSLAPQKNAPFNQTPPVTVPQKIQIIACWFYVLSLVLAFVLWQIALSNGAKPDTEIAKMLPQLSYTLAGVIMGGATVALGR